MGCKYTQPQSEEEVLLNKLIRDKSAPLRKKPIFDEPAKQNPYQQQYHSKTQYQSKQSNSSLYHFKVPKRPEPQKVIIRQPITQIRTVSCPPRQQTYESLQYTVPLQVRDNNITFSADPQDKQDKRPQQPKNIAQNLMKAASKAIMNIPPDKFSSEDQCVMKNVFTSLSSLSRKSSNRSEQKSTIQTFYESMNQQLGLLNKLVIQLDEKLDQKDRVQVKSELLKFTQQVEHLGQQAGMVIKRSKELLLSESSISKIKSNQSFSESQTSARMAQNNQKIDVLIDKLKDLNRSYRELRTEDAMETSTQSINLSKIHKRYFLNLLE